jgi:hypothetical protein
VNVSLSGQTATFTFNEGSSGGFNYLFVGGAAADVNVNSSSFTEAFVSATGPSTGGFKAPTPANKPFGSGNVDGFGNFNLTFNLQDGTGSAANQIVFTVTNTDLAHPWNSVSDVLTPNDSVHEAEVGASIAVFAGPPVNGAQRTTGFVAGNTGSPIPPPESTPEPSAMLIAVVGAIGFLGYGLRRRRKS